MNTCDFHRLNLPADLAEVLQSAPDVFWASATAELIDAACGNPRGASFDVAYDVPGARRVVEAQVARVRNGFVVNYPEPYMRRREPDCLFVADDLPSDKERFRDRFGYDFVSLREQTLQWLKAQRLVAFAFWAGLPALGIGTVIVAPANAGFFALGLAMLQGITPFDQLPDGFTPRSVIYVAPPFRHTHFNGKQVVVHQRRPGLHEMFSYNLYPGPSAKKGVYGVLINAGEQEGWVVPHCSAVQVVTPYDNVVAIMHEGASGGGKSEMLEHIHREADGRLLLGANVVTGEKRYLEIPRACELRPATDDIALCPPGIQDDSGYLRVVDAENSWFVRVNHLTEYGVDPFLEKLTAMPPEPLLFLNIDAVPGSRAMVWEHTMDAPGKPCSNPRVILPRKIVPGVVEGPISVDIRSFGVRTPPCTREHPSYGILGLFHVIPPALAWLWRLASPRGHANPSIVDTEGMSSEGVGSYWPFATGRRVDQANLLLQQIQKTPKVRYILCPNQHVGAWRAGFMPQWIAREYLARRGHAKFRSDLLIPARCPLLGYCLTQLMVEGRQVTNWFTQVNTQPEVGDEAYDQGAAILMDFFRGELEQYRTSDLLPLGRQIIECCLKGATVQDYDRLLPAG
jgi:hypothetical protein